MPEGFVYKLYIDDLIYYGYSVNPRQRFNQHRRDFLSGRRSCRSYLLFEKGTPKMTIVETITEKDKFSVKCKMQDLEHWYINNSSCVNVSNKQPPLVLGCLEKWRYDWEQKRDERIAHTMKNPYHYPSKGYMYWVQDERNINKDKYDQLYHWNVHEDRGTPRIPGGLYDFWANPFTTPYGDGEPLEY